MPVPEGLRCPSCGAIVDMHTELTGKASPCPEDIAICLYCSGLNIFTDNLLLRAATEEEKEELLKNPIVKIALIAADEVRRKRNLRGSS